MSSTDSAAERYPSISNQEKRRQQIAGLLSRVRTVSCEIDRQSLNGEARTPRNFWHSLYQRLSAHSCCNSAPIATTTGKTAVRYLPFLPRTGLPCSHPPAPVTPAPVNKPRS